MGIAISSLIEPQEINLDRLSGKIIIIDAMNMLYQFITTIRQYDGTPLKDSHGNITSHLTGLFSRCTRLMQKDLKLVFVFDGEMPKLKATERKRRDDIKNKAIQALKKATEEEDFEAMKKYSTQATKMSPEIVNESKELLNALGIPIIQAPSEGEAQASYMVKKGEGDFVGSQDFDCLIYGATKTIRNLSISQRRKKINALTYKKIMPEVLVLKDVLKDLEITLNQLRALSLIIGTDFNVGGIKGLGPKKGLTLVKEFGEDFEALFKHIKWDDFFTVSWKEVFDLISNMPHTEDYSLEWKDINEDALRSLLVDKHDFSLARISNAIDELNKSKLKSQQTNLGKFF